MDKKRFFDSCQSIIGKEKAINGIGTLGEKTLHAVLKQYFEPRKEFQEVRVGSFVADIASEQGIIEIQTRQFNKLLRKLESFLEYSRVTVVYPIPAVKYLSWIDTETGEITSRRKSPKKGSIYDAAKELYKIKYTLDNPRMNLCLCLLEVEETRYLNGWSRDKKKGSTRCDRVPVDLIDEIYFSCSDDYKRFIPQGLAGKFTSADFAKAARIRLNIAQTMLNLLTYLNVVERVGKKANSIVYRAVG